MSVAVDNDRYRPFSAAYLLLFDGPRVLLHKRKNTGFRDGEYSLVAGHIEQDESATETMMREAREEAGIELDLAQLEPAHVIHRNAEVGDRIYFDVFFRAEEWDGEAENREPEKCADLSWFDRSALPDNTVPYVAQAIKQMAKGRPFSEFGW